MRRGDVMPRKNSMTVHAVANSMRTPTPPADAPAVICQNVIKHYGTGSARVTALAGVDLEVRTGELMMLVGPSGCGKTTLIAVIAGILNPDGCKCEVFGRDFSQMSERQKTWHRGRTVGFV